MAYEPALRAFLWFRVFFTGSDVWYPEACRWLRLEHHVYPVEWKNLIERMNQSPKDRLENFDDLFPCFSEECDREHVNNWISVFRHFYNIVRMEGDRPEYQRFVQSVSEALTAPIWKRDPFGKDIK